MTLLYILIAIGVALWLIFTIISLIFRWNLYKMVWERIFGNTYKKLMKQKKAEVKLLLHERPIDFTGIEKMREVHPLWHYKEKYRKRQ